MLYNGADIGTINYIGTIIGAIATGVIEWMVMIVQLWYWSALRIHRPYLRGCEADLIWPS